jgi:hypothetical protein
VDQFNLVQSSCLFQPWLELSPKWTDVGISLSIYLGTPNGKALSDQRM